MCGLDDPDGNALHPEKETLAPDPPTMLHLQIGIPLLEPSLRANQKQEGHMRLIQHFAFQTGHNESYVRQIYSAYRQFWILVKYAQDWNGQKLLPPPLIDQMWTTHRDDTCAYVQDSHKFFGCIIRPDPRYQFLWDYNLSNHDPSFLSLEQRQQNTLQLLHQHCPQYHPKIWQYGKQRYKKLRKFDIQVTRNGYQPTLFTVYPTTTMLTIFQNINYHRFQVHPEHVQFFLQQSPTPIQPQQTVEELQLCTSSTIQMLLPGEVRLQVLDGNQETLDVITLNSTDKLEILMQQVLHPFSSQPLKEQYEFYVILGVDSDGEYAVCDQTIRGEQTVEELDLSDLGQILMARRGSYSIKQLLAMEDYQKMLQGNPNNNHRNNNDNDDNNDTTREDLGEPLDDEQKVPTSTIQDQQQEQMQTRNSGRYEYGPRTQITRWDPSTRLQESKECVHASSASDGYSNDSSDDSSDESSSSDDDEVQVLDTVQVTKLAKHLQQKSPNYKDGNMKPKEESKQDNLETKKPSTTTKQDDNASYSSSHSDDTDTPLAVKQLFYRSHKTTLTLPLTPETHIQLRISQPMARIPKAAAATNLHDSSDDDESGSSRRALFAPRKKSSTGRSAEKPVDLCLSDDDDSDDYDDDDEDDRKIPASDNGTPRTLDNQEDRTSPCKKRKKKKRKKRKSKQKRKRDEVVEAAASSGERESSSEESPPKKKRNTSSQERNNSVQMQPKLASPSSWSQSREIKTALCTLQLVRDGRGAREEETASTRRKNNAASPGERFNPRRPTAGKDSNSSPANSQGSRHSPKKRHRNRNKNKRLPLIKKDKKGRACH